jgi:hypothetical protein
MTKVSTRSLVHRHGLAVGALVAVASLLAGCGGSPSARPGGSPSPEGSTSSPSAVAYSACMRSHVVPEFPDPDSSGGIPKESAQQLGVCVSQLQVASRACAHLAPGGSGGRTQAEEQQWWNGMLEFARCMRSHGVSDWPDPTPYPPYPNDPTFEMPARLQPTAQVISKMHECVRLVPQNEVAGHIDTDSWQGVSRELEDW